MNTLATRLTVTATVAALICATPVSIDLVRTTAGSESNAHLALALDTAQARPLRGAAAHHGGLGTTFVPANRPVKDSGQRDGALMRRHPQGASPVGDGCLVCGIGFVAAKFFHFHGGGGN
jgi:hypothetical protein